MPLPLGGNKTNGLTAEQHARICTDLLAVSRTAPFARVVLNTASSTLLHYAAQAGNAPTAIPGVPGSLALDWADGVADDYDNAWPVNIRHASAKVLGTAAVFPMVEILSPSQVLVRCWSHAGVATAATVCLSVW
jgi:hypothetical protein